MNCVCYTAILSRFNKFLLHIDLFVIQLRLVHKFSASDLIIYLSANKILSRIYPFRQLIRGVIYSYGSKGGALNPNICLVYID